MQIPKKWSRRFGVLATLTGLLSALVIATVPTALVIATVPTAAHADTYPHCPEHTQLGDSHVIQGKWLYVFWIRYWEPTFNKGNGTRWIGPSRKPSGCPRR